MMMYWSETFKLGTPALTMVVDKKDTQTINPYMNKDGVIKDLPSYFGINSISFSPKRFVSSDQGSLEPLSISKVLGETEIGNQMNSILEEETPGEKEQSAFDDPTSQP